MNGKPAPKFLTRFDKQYLAKLVELGDERKALREVFGPGTPMTKHDEIMRKPLAQKELRRMMKEADANMEVAASLALRYLQRVMAVNVNDIIDPETGQPRKDVPDEYWAAVNQFEKSETESGSKTKVVMADKLRAATQILKIHGLTQPKQDVNVNIGIVQQLKSADVDEEAGALLESFFASRGALDAEIVEREDDENA
ncbi:terminase small subunit [Nitratifractor sp.]